MVHMKFDPDSNVGLANVSPTSGRQYRRWAIVGPTYIVVWVQFHHHPSTKYDKRFQAASVAAFVLRFEITHRKEIERRRSHRYLIFIQFIALAAARAIWNDNILPVFGVS